MIAAFLLSQALSPALPALDSASACANDQACLTREAGAHARLAEGWAGQPAAARAHCTAKIMAGDIDQYAGLEACLVIYRVLGDQGADETTQARIDLAPVIAERN
ncbi:MAG: hypothetical protein GC188_01055 [Alphaproteobacteria bacterium]|nr:hypothetical protein [Alphaproteobacteria bacterium]